MVEFALVWEVFSVTRVPAMEFMGGAEVSGADIWERGLDQGLTWGRFLSEVESLFNVGVNSSVAWIPLVLLVGVRICSSAYILEIWEFVQLKSSCIISSNTKNFHSVTSDIIINILIVDEFSEHILMLFDFILLLKSCFFFLNWDACFWKRSLMSNSKLIIGHLSKIHFFLLCN